MIYNLRCIHPFSLVRLLFPLFSLHFGGKLLNLKFTTAQEVVLNPGTLGGTECKSSFATARQLITQDVCLDKQSRKMFAALFFVHVNCRLVQFGGYTTSLFTFPSNVHVTAVFSKSSNISGGDL